MAAKEFIGLALDSDRIYTARLRMLKDRFELVAAETLELPRPMEETPRMEDGISGMEEDADQIFGLEEDIEPGQAGDTEQKTEDALDDFDMVEDSADESGMEDANEAMLSSWFARNQENKWVTGLNIPLGKTVFMPLEKVHPKKMKKKERAGFFEDKLRPQYGDVLDTEQYQWEVDAEGNGWLVSYDNDRRFLQLLEAAEAFGSGKIMIMEMMPDELLLAGLACEHYNFPENEVTGLLSIGMKHSRLIFLKGNRLIHVLPIVNEGSTSRTVLQTIFSKLLFEIDKGALEALHRLVIMHSSVIGNKAVDFFSEQLDQLEVELFRPDPEKLVLSGDWQDDPGKLQPYAAAIAAAVAASGVRSSHWTSCSFLPAEVRDRQKVFKLEWHGVVLLALIACTPVILNHWYQQSASEEELLRQAIQFNESQILEMEPVLAEVENLMNEQMEYEEYNERLSEWAANSYIWTETLGKLNRGLAQIPSTWITSLRVTDEHLFLDGLTLGRDRIALLTELFDDAHVLQVVEGEMRNRTVYSFAIRVNNIHTPDERFSPSVLQPNEP